jgi:hypothetical protein
MLMGGIRHFVPGQREVGIPVLAGWRQPIPAGIVRAYLEAYTSPGDLVVLPFCQGPAAVREAALTPSHDPRLAIDVAPTAGPDAPDRPRPREQAAAGAASSPQGKPASFPAESSPGRRVVAVHYDPSLLLPTQVALSGLTRRDLDAAVARLGDSPKAGVPLRHHLNSLYATLCPACGMPVPAQAFVWEREQNVPVVRELVCPACDWEGQTTATGDDQALAASVPVPELTRHYLLGRLTPRDGEIRPRLERLLALYPPRSQYALATLTRKIVERGSRESDLALRLLLLDCLERCHSLHPPGRSGMDRRPSSLRQPARFVERNVWQAFEDAADRVGASLRPELNPVLALRPGEVEPHSAYVGVGQVRNLPDHLPAASASLILMSPPRLDPVAWTFSTFWTAWIFGADAAAPLWPLLRQRTADPAWYARVLSTSLRTLKGLLAPGARLIVALDDGSPTGLEAMCLSASQAGLRTEAVLHAGCAYRIELSGETPPQPVYPLRQVAVDAVEDAFRQAGEPLTWETVHAAVYGHLAQSGQLRRSPPEDAPSALDWLSDEVDAALVDAPLVHLIDDVPPRWWLPSLEGMGSSLADRTESAAVAALDKALGATWDALVADVYARLPSSLAPDRELVEACLRSYAQPLAHDLWQTRDEDLPMARTSEREALLSDLQRLGDRFGYGVAPAPEGYDLAWADADGRVAVFRLQADAQLGQLLHHPGSDVPRYLVLPGGRSALVDLKLRRNPVLREMLERANWRFIKTRHVRWLAAQDDVERFGLHTIIGLDPIVEQEEAQIPMFS